jgi:PAS domain S-box-containing protein
MNDRPTYTELEQKIDALEKEIERLRGLKADIRRSESRLKEAENLARLGHWELDLISNTLYWSDEIYRIFELDPQEFGATYEAFLATVHPEDIHFVNKAFRESVRKKTGYDLVHRLLLKDGRVKFVHEKCRTVYGTDGQALRSIGTVQDITERMQQDHGFAGIIGRSPKMMELFDTIRQVTDVDIPVLVQGESGTGKELVARAIHNHGPRAAKHFVPVNCGALPEGLLESELFGHVKGAFTGAIRDRKGRFEMASGGTLFLDEIADMPKSVQVKLLRVLQDGKFEQVGSDKTVNADVRIISAANRSLKQEVQKGNFREDLYYRISVIPIDLPPLRKRQDDISLLVNNFLTKLSREGQLHNGLSKDALAVMIDYAWPGNVRELQSTLQYALIKSKGRLVQPHHLPIELQKRRMAKSTRGPSRKLDSDGVQDALARSGGNKAKAARLLGVGRATLYRFLSDHPDLG